MRTFFIALGFAVMIVSESSAQLGQVFVVSTTADGADSNPGDGICSSAGWCTLRAAIQEANALSGADTIHFAMGSGLQTINVASALPAVSDPVTIDGTTQPGFVDRPIVVIDGGGAGADGLTITAGGSIVRGLVIILFSGDGVVLRNGGGNVLETNYVGMAADGTTAAGNGNHGVVLNNSSNNRIGGPNRSQRNIISANTGKGNGGGIVISGGSGNVVQGNFIGTDISGTLDRGNEGRGIAISGSSNNLIGGPEPGAGNLISGNRATGVRMLGGSHNNTVQANYIGVNRTATGFIANDRGVQIRSGNNNRVLGNLIAGQVYDGVLIWQSSMNNLVQGNLIAYNGRGPTGDINEDGYSGIWVAEGTQNRLLSNSIFGNTNLGIIVGYSWAPLPNDAGDADIGANQLQNYPTLTTATASATGTTIAGALSSAAATSFLVQFFADALCDPSGYGQGRYSVGQATVTTDAAGNASFAILIGLAVPRGWIMTATATDPEGNTSEFSACATVR